MRKMGNNKSGTLVCAWVALCLLGQGDGVRAEGVRRTSCAETNVDVRAFEQKAVDSDNRPPVLQMENLEKYSTNCLDYALNNGLAMTRKGRIWASWISGGDGPGAFTAANWSDDFGETWTDVKMVIDGHDGTDAERTNIVGTFWLDPDGNLHCFTDQSLLHFDGRAGIWESVCKNPDDARPVWSKARRLGNGHVINKPIVLANGDWAMAAYLNGTWQKRSSSVRGAFPELDAERGAVCYVSTDRGKTWEKRGIVKLPAEDRPEGKVEDWQESQLVELRDGTLRMFARVVDGHVGGLMAADSNDGGRTFSAARRLATMDGPNARFQIQRLASGRLVFVKHGEPLDFAMAWRGRRQLTAYLSDDDGETWRGGLVLDWDTGSYPDLFQAADGSIYVSHDHGRRTEAEIRVHRFTEEDVLACRIVSAKGKLGMLAFRAMDSETNRRRFGSLVLTSAGRRAEKIKRLAARMTEERCFEKDGETLLYRWHSPRALVPGRTYPLVVLFHGAGERGADNIAQLEHGADEILAYAQKVGEEFFFIAGQVPSGEQWVNTPWTHTSHVMPKDPSAVMRLALALVEQTKGECPVDASRIYATGISMGGYGTWDAVQRRPDLFAAAIPICGGGDVACAGRIKDVPIWCFHGDRDGTVPVCRSRDMYHALRKLGGSVRYREYPGVGHNCWETTYRDESVLKWLFAQRKGSIRTSACPVRIEVKPGQSLADVQKRVRAVRKGAADGIEVVLAPGEYELPEGLAFGPEDGGLSPSVPVVWRAEQPGLTKIVGAWRIPPESFTPVDDGKTIFSSDLSDLLPTELGATGEKGVPTALTVFQGGRYGTPCRLPLSRSYEWWLDQGSRRLFAVPFMKRPSAADDILICLGEHPLIVGTGVANLSFRDLRFGFARGALVRMSNVENVRFENCRFQAFVREPVLIDGVRCETRGCEISVDDELVVQAKDSTMPRETVLFVATHSDDTEGFAATAKLLTRYYDVHLADLCHGDYELGESGVRDDPRMPVRMREELAACAYLGITPHFLSEPDADAHASRKSVEQLTAIVKKVKPRAVFVHWPLDRHADHVQSAAIVARALVKAGRGPRPGQPFDKTMCERYYFEVCIGQTKQFHPTYSVDVTETIEDKLSMLRRYVEQNVGDRIAVDNEQRARRRGSERSPKCPYAELFSTFDGKPIPGGVLDRLPQSVLSFPDEGGR